MRSESTAFDVTPTAERMLHALTTILDSLDDGIVSIDQDARISLFNAAAARMTGVSRESALGATVHQVRLSAPLVDALLTGEETVERPLGNSAITMICSPVRVDGRRVGSVAALRDRSALEKALAELRSVRHLADTLDAVVEHAYEGVIVVDERGIITLFNKAYEEFLGVKRENLIGRHVTDCIPNTRMHIVVQTGLPEIGERQRIKDEETVVSRIPIVKDGRIVGAVGKVLFRDVGELRSLADRLSAAERRAQFYEQELKRLGGISKHTLDDMLGHSKAISAVKRLASRVAQGKSTILIRGESGTGKEILAHAVHNASPRSEAPFISVNCAAIPRDLLEAEFFGHEKGAFTGALSSKAGRFEQADGGTIFLDEIGDMPMEMQAKILRVLQEREFQRVGGQSTVSVDIRIMAATNKDLEQMVKEGAFREDLYYRLNVVTLTIPPLRERLADVPELVQHFMASTCRELRIPCKPMSSNAVEILQQYDWPGNVRQLQNVVEFLANTVESDTIMPQHLPLSVRMHAHEPQPAQCSLLAALVEDVEREAIRNALRATDGNKRQAARRLGVQRSSLYAKLRKYGI